MNVNQKSFFTNGPLAVVCLFILIWQVYNFGFNNIVLELKNLDAAYFDFVVFFVISAAHGSAPMNLLILRSTSEEPELAKDAEFMTKIYLYLSNAGIALALIAMVGILAYSFLGLVVFNSPVIVLVVVFGFQVLGSLNYLNQVRA